MSSFKQRVLQTFSDIKKEKFSASLPKKLPIYDNNGNLYAFLRPLTKNSQNNKNEIKLLAKWRRENSFAFPSQFRVTEAGTKVWLQKALINNPTRILFFIETVDRKPRLIGHIGLFTFNFQEGSCEIDNVVRGNKRLKKGVMSSALKAILNWTFMHLGPKKIYLKVFADNRHAINFYKKNGFVRYSLLPLRKIIKPGNIVWEETKSKKNIDKYFLKMVYKQ